MNIKSIEVALFDVVLIRSNPILYEMRVLKIVRSLSKKYSLLVLGWDRDGTHSSSELIGENVLVKRFKIKAPYARFYLLFYYPLFWLWVFKNLLIYRPKVVHACDLDALIPGYLFRLFFSVKLVFDNFDRFAMAFIPIEYRLLYSVINKIEEVLAKNSDALITVSEERKSSFGGYLPKHVEIIMNCPYLEDYDENVNGKQKLEGDGVLTLVYAGAISRDRGLLLIGKAIEDEKNVRLILAGRVFDDTLEHLLKNPNVSYVGFLKAEEVLKLEKMAEVIPVLYDPSIPINRVASPNKLFEAMMLGVPVITNVCRDIVVEAECGLIANYDAQEVKRAILRLKNNPLLRKKLGINGRQTFEKKFNWKIMEEKLLKLYCSLSN
jgi:glycosyltransferase involved in cell wall biosynthesis